MAHWDRDPKARIKATWLLVAVEAAAVILNFFFISSAYLHYVNVRLSPDIRALMLSATTSYVIVSILTACCLAAIIVVGVRYARGSPRMRWTMIGINAGLIALGLMWFFKNRLAGGEAAPIATICGLFLPMITLFPLLWPLIAFRPAGTPPSPLQS